MVNAICILKKISGGRWGGDKEKEKKKKGCHVSM